MDVLICFDRSIMNHYDRLLRTDRVVCPDCNIEDSLSSNMRGEIAENTAYTMCFLLSDSEFSGL